MVPCLPHRAAGAPPSSRDAGSSSPGVTASSGGGVESRGRAGRRVSRGVVARHTDGPTAGRDRQVRRTRGGREHGHR
ncbi:hypothetical protein Ae406Ps2_4286 [Pseudonocardia sp. Ae406_Ps2]|nr:hypothetical protein Ae331Ps2_1672c [Pseudonocardia sp. Ae331_Ps2]OLM04286.1 hypothetical protein Ae406Ps2_4286 [Pseudonocardia sp. Ae406_Ps2]OLM10879.1 hypothetical protein Ae505Ps2_1002c [Pseudonocardia sp. Ae505_Ps2]OLM25847.1 hypothetical protein Ae706Ps2_4280 [Pseudonocardia sp. Ae706_Ps2]